MSKNEVLSEDQQPELFTDQFADFKPEDYQKIILDKTNEINDLHKRINEIEQEKNNITGRALKVHERNQILENAPELAREIAIMDYRLSVARNFLKAKAFPNYDNEYQIYVLIQSGSEMGLKPMESMQSLYLVNGGSKWFGDNMAGRITGAGYRLEYEETDKKCTVRCYHPSEEIDFDVKETAHITNPVFASKKAVKFAPQNKMRFHAIRMIASFHLPHLFGSTMDEFSHDFNQWSQQQADDLNVHDVNYKKEKNRVAGHIEGAKSLDDLTQVIDLVEKFDLTQEYDQKSILLTNQQNQS